MHSISGWIAEPTKGVLHILAADAIASAWYIRFDHADLLPVIGTAHRCARIGQSGVFADRSKSIPSAYGRGEARADRGRCGFRNRGIREDSSDPAQLGTCGIQSRIDVPPSEEVRTSSSALYPRRTARHSAGSGLAVPRNRRVQPGPIP